MATDVILDTVRQAYAAGLCVLPTRADGSKAPDVESWTPFKLARPELDQMRVWDFAHRDGFGIIAGPVSGHCETWDFDDAATFEAFIVAATAAGLDDVVQRIRAGYEDRTPANGVRWLVRYPAEITWSDQTFARRPGRDGEPKIKTLIESTTFAILAPSNGQTHPSGGAYVRVSGGFATIAGYIVKERDALIALARSFDEMPRKAAEPRPTRQKDAAGDRPGDDFNARAIWSEILEPHGWTRVFERGEITNWRRPGRAFGISATTNVHGSDLFWCFSSSTVFESDKSFSKFGAYAVLEHGGDYRQAALALAKRGYGAQPAEEPTPRTAPGEQSTGYSRPAVPLSPGDVLLAPLRDRPFSGWFARGAVHLVAGSSGAGKTSFMLALLPAQRRGERYLGHVGQRHDFLVVFADRGTVSNTETLQRLRIDPATLPIAHLPPTASGATALHAIRCVIEAESDLPAAVFVEGADLLVEDASKTQIVTPFVTGLRAMAEHYNLSIVLSVGSPKARPQEQYAYKRDQVFGSQAWSRLADTVCVLSVTADGTEATRDLVVLHRNAAAEKFCLAFVDGQLVPADRPPATADDMLRWFADVEMFTKQQFRTTFHRLSGQRATELLDGFIKIGTLKVKRKNDRTYYVYRPRAEKGSDSPKVSVDTPAEEVRTDSGVHGHSSDNPRCPRFSESGSEKSLGNSEEGSASAWSPQNTVLLSFLDSSSSSLRTKGHVFGGTTPFEAGGGSDELPACLAELTEPDFSDPIGAHDEETEDDCETY